MIDPALAAEQAEIAWAIVVYRAVREEVVVSDVTTVVAEQVRAPAVAAVHRAWEVSEEAVAVAEALVAVEVVAVAAEAVAVVVVLAAAAAVAVAVVVEGGNKS